MSEQPRKPDAADVPVDPELARLYRAAAREEPPQHLDAAILAAARREAGRQPRPLEPAVRSGSSCANAGEVPHAASRYRRWHVPVALAAVLLLSVSVVTLQREGEERQRLEAPGAPPALQERRDHAPAEPPQSPPLPSAQKAVPERNLADTRKARPPDDSVRRAPRLQREEAAPAAAAEAEAPSGQPGQAFGVPQAARPRMPEDHAEAPAVPSADTPPEKWGERIMGLRGEGKTAEADAVVAEFRRRFPDRLVPEEWTR